jgi:hypothetical protein
VPFLATKTLKWIAHNSELTEKQRRTLKDDFYVDDLLTSSNDENTMLENISAIKNESKKKGMILTKIPSNSKYLKENSIRSKTTISS